MTDYTLNLVDAIISGRATDIETAFQEAITNKISIAMDDRRTEIAQSMFTKESVQLDEYWAKGNVNGKQFHIKTDDEYSHSQIHKQNPHLSSVEAKAVHAHTNTDKFIDEPEGTSSKQHGHTVNVKSAGGHHGDVKEEYESLDEAHGVYLRGGTIDSKKDHPKHGQLYSTHDSEEDAKAKASRMNKTLSAGEKKYYKMRFHAKPITESVEESFEDYSLEELEDFMMSEEFEQLDELSKKTLGSYVKKASGKLASHGINMVGSLEKSDIANAAYHGTKIDKRQKGISKATDKLTKEDFELEEAVTASQLIDNHNSSDHGGAQHFSNVDGKHHSWNYVKKNKEGTKYEVTTDKGEAEGIAHKGKFLKMPK